MKSYYSKVIPFPCIYRDRLAKTGEIAVRGSQ